MIRPIETHYRGYRFRSRLEARWALCLDAVDLKWEYEPEGYNMDGTLYLPDFRLERVWLEIKPPRDIPPQELSKCSKFQEAAKGKIEPGTLLILAGNCGMGEYVCMSANGTVLEDYRLCECPLCHRIYLMGYYANCVYCDYCDIIDRNEGETDTGYFHKGLVFTKDGFDPLSTPRIRAAFAKARATRFGDPGFSS
jgi:hypothetical protein